LRVFICLVSQD